MRMEGLAYISGKDAINLGVTGPSLRGSGVKYDIRHNDPYEVYDELDWHMCTSDEGDVYARYRVRIEEMRMSVQIVRQILEKMPKTGPVRVKAPRTAPEGTGFARMEDPRGESFMYVVGDGSDKPYRLKVRSPFFVTLSASPYMLKGYKVADVPAIMGMLDVCMGETDR
jgi:NADH-quinone oxidoreductase subunit D